MIKIRPTVVAVICLVSGLVVGGSALAASSPSSHGRTFRIRQITTSLVPVDVGAPGLSVGDGAVYHTQFRSLGGRPIGQNHAACTVLTPLTAALAHCVGTAELPGGTIEWAGDLGLTAERFTLALTGGTGAYRGAQGQVTVRYTNPPTNTRSIATIELIGHTPGG